MKIKSILEAQLADKPKVSSARLKRIAREVSEFTGAKLDAEDSEQDLLILTVWKTLYISDLDNLDKKFGEHDEFDIPEFRTPWYRWEVDGVWIILKDYSGNLQFEVLPATTREQPQDRYLRQRHDEIMDPAKYESVMEAKYFKDDDKYQCPDCEGEGGFYVQDGPDDYDVERCEMCNGRGWLKNRDVQHLLRYNDLYKPSEFKRLKEAKYAEPNVMNLVGSFYYDDRNADEIIEYDRVVVKFKVDHEKESTWYDNAVLLDDIKFLGGRPLKTAKDLGIEKGSTVGYQRDKHGWMVFGYIQGQGTSSPWNVSGK